MLNWNIFMMRRGRLINGALQMDKRKELEEEDIEGRRFQNVYGTLNSLTTFIATVAMFLNLRLTTIIAPVAIWISMINYG